MAISLAAGEIIRVGWPWVTMVNSQMGAIILLATVLINFAAVLHLAKRKMDGGTKATWAIIILFGWFFPFSVLGSAIYYMYGRK
jgi:hypothetical protein